MRLSIRKKHGTLLWAVPVGLMVLLTLMAGPALARVYEQPQEALAAVFPGAKTERKPVYLSKDEQKNIGEAAGVELKSRFYTFYQASKNGKIIGYGTFVTDRVRTKEQTLFVAVDPSGKILDVRLISFFEPEEYRPPDRWLALLKGKSLNESLQPGKDLPAMSGATLTAGATSDTVRMVLALVKAKL